LLRGANENLTAFVELEASIDRATAHDPLILPPCWPAAPMGTRSWIRPMSR